MPDDPKPFSDAQRELFDAVANLNRIKADTFCEADRWIDTKPPTAQAKYARFRDAHREVAAERRRRKDRSYGVELSRPEKGHGIVTYRREWWKQMADSERQAVLRDARNFQGGNLRNQRRQWAERMREEAAHGQPHELIELAARRLTRDEPLVFDAMNPHQKALWARRLLRVIWILTDTADLTATNLEWLCGWTWGEHPLEFLGDWPDGDVRAVPRLWSRVTILDAKLDEWEQLTKNALRALEEAEPGATVFAATPKPVEVPTIIPDGFYSPTDIAKAMNASDKADAIRMALKRLFDDHRLPDDAWIENNNPAKGQAKILYRMSSVRPLLARFDPH
jgi:hypothetical protein